jgi:hypothetical protein
MPLVERQDLRKTSFEAKGGKDGLKQQVVRQLSVVPNINGSHPS